MQIYVAAKYEQKAVAERLMRLLRQRGHAVTEDWTRHRNIKPYADNLEMTRKYEIADKKGVRSSDVAIFIAPEGAASCYFGELGMAIMAHDLTGTPGHILAVGEFNGNSMLYFDPAVERVRSVEEALLRVDTAAGVDNYFGFVTRSMVWPLAFMHR